MVGFIDFLCPEFVKFKILSPKMSLQSSDFYIRFQSSEFLEFSMFFKVKKITIHSVVSFTKEHRISKIQRTSYDTVPEIFNTKFFLQNTNQRIRA